jgi:hypothetical protein
MPRAEGWCQGTATFTTSAMKAIAQCPGSGDYVAAPAKTRYVEIPPGGDPFECGLRYCGGNGHCMNQQHPVCYCDEGFWGPACEYNQEARDQEKEILKEIFIYTNGFSWKNVEGWCKSGIDYCDWFGITCRLELCLSSHSTLLTSGYSLLVNMDSSNALNLLTTTSWVVSHSPLVA